MKVLQKKSLIHAIALQTRNNGSLCCSLSSIGYGSIGIILTPLIQQSSVHSASRRRLLVGSCVRISGEDYMTLPVVKLRLPDWACWVGYIPLPGPSSQGALWCPLFEQGRLVGLGRGVFVRQPQRALGFLGERSPWIAPCSAESRAMDAHVDGSLAGSQTLALKQRWCN